MQKHLMSKPKFKKAHSKKKRAPGPQKKKLSAEGEITKKIQKKIEREIAARAVKFNEELEVVKADPRHLKK
jgi:hypothetical protein